MFSLPQKDWRDVIRCPSNTTLGKNERQDPLRRLLGEFSEYHTEKRYSCCRSQPWSTGGCSKLKWLPNGPCQHERLQRGDYNGLLFIKCMDCNKMSFDPADYDHKCITDRPEWLASMYCIKCFKENKKSTAEYIHKGSSLCSEHMKDKVKVKEAPLLTHRSKPKLATRA